MINISLSLFSLGQHFTVTTLTWSTFHCHYSHLVKFSLSLLPLGQHCFQLVDNKLRQDMTEVESERQSRGSGCQVSAKLLRTKKCQDNLYLMSVQEERTSKHYLLEQPATYLKSLVVISGHSFQKSKLSHLASRLSSTSLLCSTFSWTPASSSLLLQLPPYWPRTTSTDWMRKLFE